MRESYEKLRAALDAAEAARACIAQNRGLEKEQAREGYEYVVGEELGGAMMAALEDAIGDLDARQLERLGRALFREIEKKGEAT